MTRTDLSEGKRNRKTQALSALLSASALGLFLEGCGADDINTILATPAVEKHVGDTSIDTVSYANSAEAVDVDLVDGTGKYGDAAGDTFENIKNLIGSDHHDVLAGNEESNALTGGGGGDILRGHVGDDELYGGADYDRLYGGVGNDVLYGETGDDILYGGVGNDELYGGAGYDILYGNDGNDTLHGGAGVDSLYGDEGDDVLNGDAGNDAIDGNDGNDTLHGGAGDDTLYGGTDNDILYGDGVGDLGSRGGNDVLYGDAGDDTLYGGAGNDTLYGGVGNDTLNGGAGTDTYRYVQGDGMDTITDVRLEAINLQFLSFTRTEIEAAVINRDHDNLVIEFDSDNKITINDAYYTPDGGTEQEAFTINAYYLSAPDTTHFLADAYTLSFAAA